MVSTSRFRPAARRAKIGQNRVARRRLMFKEKNVSPLVKVGRGGQIQRGRTKLVSTNKLNFQRLGGEFERFIDLANRKAA